VDELPEDDERNHLLYLSQIDQQLSRFMRDSKSLKSDLATRLLLEAGVVIPDIYFFTSREIQDDLERSDESWIRRGLQRELIVPAFREKDVHSFTEDLELSSMQSMVIGFVGDPTEKAIQLDAAVYGRNIRRITWPDRIGASFGSLLSEVFLTESLDDNLFDAKKSSLWEQSRDLRHKYLDLGWQLEREPAITGLRRSSLFKAMAVDVGFGGDPADCAGMISCADRSVRPILQAIILWINELYNYNQAHRFKLKSSFPVGEGHGSLMMPSLLWGTSRESSAVSDLWMYSHTIRWPSLAALRRTSPDRLLGLRADTPGVEFVNSLRLFQSDPSDVTWEVFRTNVNAYGRSICDAVGTDVRSGLEIRHLVTRSRLAIGTIVSGLAGSIASQVSGSAAAHVASLVTTAVGALYIPIDQYVRVRAASGSVELPIAASREGNIRIDMPTA
jgi:hypothetical protein